MEINLITSDCLETVNRELELPRNVLAGEVWKSETEVGAEAPAAERVQILERQLRGARNLN